MNPQPNEAVCSVITFFVIISIIIVAIKKYYETDGIIINDMIEIGSISHNSTKLSPIVTYKPVRQKKKKNSNIAINQTLKHVEKRLNKIDKMMQKQIKQKTQNNKQEDTKYTILHEDCFLALIGLGMSKKEATFVVNSTFNKYKIKTVQEFIYLALGKK